jgi:hypothetical protein
MMLLERVGDFNDYPALDSYLYFTVRNNLWDWQSLQPNSKGGFFFQFCDALEVKDGVSAPATGWGLDHALGAWSGFWRDGYLENRQFVCNLGL